MPVDARYKLTMLTRRPDPMPAESVGSWGALMEAMGILAVFANAGIIVFTTQSFADFGAVYKFVVFFILEQVSVLAWAEHEPLKRCPRFEPAPLCSKRDPIGLPRPEAGDARPDRRRAAGAAGD
jgi:hypothetical protein